MIGPLSKEEEFFPSDHRIMVMADTLRTKFDGGGNQELKVDIFWGIKDLNTEGGSHWDPEFIGKAIMDEKFDISPVDSQKSIMKFCSDLRLKKFVSKAKVICWIETFDTWVQTNYKNNLGRITKRLPLPPAVFNKELQLFRKTLIG